MRFGLGPDDKNISDWRVRDPHLGSIQHIAAIDLFRSGFHPGRIAARIRFGQAKTADPFTTRQLWQVLAPLLLRAIGIDRIDHQRRLHRHHRSVAAIDPLDLTRHKAIGNIRSAETAIGFGQGDTQQAHFAHLRKDRRIGRFLREGVDDPWCQPFAAIGLRTRLNHPFIFGQLIGQPERIGPIETAQIGRVLGVQYLGLGVHGGSSPDKSMRSNARPIMAALSWMYGCDKALANAIRPKVTSPSACG